jgi:hypothetical protein
MYRVPAFPLTVNVWRAATGTGNPPDVVTVGNLAWGQRKTTSTGIPLDSYPDQLLSYLLIPPLTDIRDSYSPGGADVVEVPAGSLRYYQVVQVDDVGKGFPNEFRFAVIFKLAPWPSPIP